jgi:uncharacterized protein YjiS (DUF1127 family)
MAIILAKSNSAQASFCLFRRWNRSHNAFIAWLGLSSNGYRFLKGRLCCSAVGQCLPEMEYTMSPLKTISEKLAAWRRYRDAVRELSQLSNRELDDIGIRRGDIEFIVRRSVASQVSA